jgi:hypothetical protein
MDPVVNLFGLVGILIGMTGNGGVAATLVHRGRRPASQPSHDVSHTEVAPA